MASLPMAPERQSLPAMNAPECRACTVSASCKDTPHGWAQVVAAAYDEFKADRVVAEKNQGFDMVEEIVRSVHPNIAYKGIAARLGKKLRAEPVAALYEQAKIHHIGYFTKLEDQWTQWVPDITNKSPDRLDALVHGFTELGMVGGGNTAKAWLESMAKTCIACGMPNPLEAIKCSKCGIDLPEHETVASVPDEEFGLTSGIAQPGQPAPTGVDPNAAIHEAIRQFGSNQPYQPFQRRKW